MWKRQNSDRPSLTPEQLLQRAAAYCAQSEHCPQEVREKLRTWGASAEVQEQIVDRLIDDDFISEERYCRAFTGDKIRYQGWGKEKVRQALALKRLPSELVREALDAFPEEEYTELLQRLIQRKDRELEGEEPRQYATKMLRFLMNRGFSYSDIRQHLNNIDETD